MGGHGSGVAILSRHRKWEGLPTGNLGEDPVDSACLACTGNGRGQRGQGTRPAGFPESYCRHVRFMQDRGEESGKWRERESGDQVRTSNVSQGLVKACSVNSQ